MALKTVIETIDGLDEAIAQLYTKTDTGFILALDGIDDHPDVKGLKGAYAAEKAKRDAAKAKEAALEAQIAELQQGKPDEAAILKLRQQLETERDKWKGEAETALQRLTAVTRDRPLNEALTGAGITEPAFVKAATAMLGSSVKMEGDKPFVDSDLGPVDLATFVKRWASGEGAAFVSKPQGGGARSGDGGSAIKVTGNLAGSKDERLAALKARFPDLG